MSTVSSSTTVSSFHPVCVRSTTLNAVLDFSFSLTESSELSLKNVTVLKQKAEQNFSKPSQQTRNSRTTQRSVKEKTLTLSRGKVLVKRKPTSLAVEQAETSNGLG